MIESSFLSAEDRVLFQACLACQLNRSVAINVLHLHNRYFESKGASGVNGDTVVPGTFIRALAAVAPGEEKHYIVAQVEGVVKGDVYTGFSSNPNVSSQWYLRLRLPHRQHSNEEDDTLSPDYDLSSISNSKMLESEFAAWLRAVREGVYPGPVPTLALLRFTAERLTPFQRKGGAVPLPQPPMTSREDLPSPPQRSPPPLSPTGPTGAPVSASSSHAATPIPLAASGPVPQKHCRSPPPLAARSPLKNSGGGEQSTVSADPWGITGSAPPPNDLQRRQAEEFARRECLHQLSESGSVFLKVFDNCRPSQLRLIERDLMDYLQVVRDTIVEKRETCIICLERVPSVILYPCKHRAICRQCAAIDFGECCPLCRESIMDMFEVEEV